MTSPVLLRLSLVLAVVTLASCRRSQPIVDLSPLGDAVRFLAVAIVLGAIVTAIFELWGRDS